MSFTRIMKAAVMLSATDKMTTTINRAFGNAENRLTSFQRKTKQLSRVSADMAKKSAMIGAAIATPLILAGRESVKFEDSMADVAKVLNMQAGSTELKEMGTQAQKLSVHLGKMPADAAAMVAALGQGGTAKKDLFDIAKFTGEMAVAFDIAANSAGESFVKTKNALGITNAATKEVMNSVNALGNNVAASSEQILTSLSQGGAASARMLKISGQQAAALGATYIAMGKSGSEAGTLIQAMSRGLGKNNQVSKLFQSAGGGMEGILKVLETGAKLSGAAKADYFSQFGLYGQQIALAADNTELLAKSLKFATDQAETADSVAQEFANRSNTRSFEIAKLQSQLTSLAIKAGNALLPVVTQLFNIVSPYLDKLTLWIDKNPKLTAQIVKGAAVFAAMNFAASGLFAAVSGVSKGLSMLSGGMKMVSKFGRIVTVVFAKPGLILSKLGKTAMFLSKALRMVGFAVSWVGRLLIANPIGIAVAAIAGAAYLIWKHWAKIKPFFVKLWSDVSAIFSNAWEGLKTVPKKFYEAGKSIIQMLWNGIKSMASKPIEAIKNMVSRIREYLPFSPAKIGPLKDLHKVRIVETIAQTIKAAPAVNAMKQTVNQVAGLTPGRSGLSPVASNNNNSAFSLNYAPTINVGGGADAGELFDVLQRHKDEVRRMALELFNGRKRTAF